MFLFLMLACFDEEPDTAIDTTDDTAVDDTGVDDTGVDDTGTDNSCALEGFFGTVLGINNTKEDVAVPLDCLLEVDESQISNVRLDGVEAEWTLDGQTLMIDPSNLNNTGLLTMSVVVLDEELSTTFRAHSMELNLEQPEGLYDLGADWTGGLQLISESEADLVVMSDDQIAVVDRNGKVDPPCDLTVEHGICLYGRCFASASGRGFYGTNGTSVVAVDADSCKQQTWAGKSWNFQDIGQNSKGTMVGLHRGAKNDYALVDVSSGESLSLAVYTGTVRLVEDSILHAGCKESLVFEDIDPSSGKVLNSDVTSLDCSPDEMEVQLYDVAGDGEDDQLITLTYGTQQTLVWRKGEGRGSFGTPQVLVDAPYVALRGDGQVVYTQDNGASFSGKLEEGEKSTAAMENPTFVGMAGANNNVLHSMRPSGGSGTVMDGRYLVLPQEVEVVAESASGQLLTRKWDGSDASYGVDDVAVWVLRESPNTGIVGGMPLSYTIEDLVIDEREMSTGADWDFRIVGDPEASEAWAIALQDDGLELVWVDLEVMDTALLKKRKPLGTRGIREQDIKASGLVRPSSTPSMTNAVELGAFEGELSYTSLVMTMPWETEGACPCATVLLPGVSEDPAEMEAQAIVLATSDAKDCSDLPVPLGMVDVLGDGGSQVVLSDGTMYRINAFQIPEKVVMEKDGDFYGMQSADFNGDGLGDVLFMGDAGQTLWLSAGDGTGLGYENTAPAWSQVAQVAGSTPSTASKRNPAIWMYPRGSR